MSEANNFRMGGGHKNRKQRFEHPPQTINNTLLNRNTLNDFLLK